MYFAKHKCNRYQLRFNLLTTPAYYRIFLCLCGQFLNKITCVLDHAHGQNPVVVPENTYFVIGGSILNPYFNCTINNPPGISTQWYELATAESGRLISSDSLSLSGEEFRIEGTHNLVLIYINSRYAGTYVCINTEFNPVSASAELIVLGELFNIFMFSLVIREFIMDVVFLADYMNSV